jgi:YgiT-type zinc finger domain-containing protein
MKQDICEYCDPTIELAVIQVPFEYLKKTIYVDNVPVRRCRKCGEVYYEAEVYKRLESIAENRMKIKRSITFPLADYRITESLEA